MLFSNHGSYTFQLIEDNSLKHATKEKEIKPQYKSEEYPKAKLKYFIKAQDTIFVRNGKKAYVQAKLLGIEDDDQTGNGMGYVESELFLYEVSEVLEK